MKGFHPDGRNIHTRTVNLIFGMMNMQVHLSLFFETAQSDALAQKTITEEWIYDDRFGNRVTTWASTLNTVLSRSPSSLQVKDWHLVIKVVEYSTPAWTDDDCFRCVYYFVNHDNESLFWLSEFIIDEHLTAIRGPVTYSQIYRK